MKFQSKLVASLFSLVSISLVVFLLGKAIGFIAFKSLDIIIICNFAVWLVFPIVFSIVYLKMKPRVDSAKSKFLDELKPKAPLRFCPSDEELVKSGLKLFTSENESEAEKSVEKSNNMEDNFENGKSPEKNSDYDEMTM